MAELEGGDGIFDVGGVEGDVWRRCQKVVRAVLMVQRGEDYVTTVGGAKGTAPMGKAKGIIGRRCPVVQVLRKYIC